MEHRRRLRALSERDRGVLELERAWGSRVGAQTSKFAEAEASLGLSPQAYVLILSGLVNDPAAAEFAPDVINSLRHTRAVSLLERSLQS